MTGPKLTAADIVAYPGLKLLLRASQRPEAAPLELGLDGFNTRFPGIAAWTHTGWSSSQAMRRPLDHVSHGREHRPVRGFAPVGSSLR
jgi:hypothetical protein